MIFDPSGLQISPAYAIPLAKKIKEAAQAGKEIIIRAESLSIYGDGSQTRSFCYVDDLIEGIKELAHE